MIKKIVLIGVLAGFNYSVYAENLALIMGISEYERSPLSGIYKDIDNAKKFAQSMSIPEKNIYIFKDKQLDFDGLNQTLDKFSKSINSGDRVFIYFSGHGTNTDRGYGCDQGIVTQDMKVLYRKDFQTYIDRVTSKAAKTLVFLDTCFSGGIVEQARMNGLDHNSGNTRSFSLDKDGFPQAKFLDMKSVSGRQSCEAENVISVKGARDFATVAKETPNYYFLGAASASEVAIDGGVNVGGWATNALVACVSESDQQEIKNGIITMSDARICAQNKINEMLNDRKQRRSDFPYSAMTLTVGSGNGSGSMPLGFTYTNSGSTTQNEPSQRIEPIALFKNIFENSDHNKKLILKSLKQNFKINQDNLEISIKSPVDGYLTLFIAGSSNKIYQIFPDTIDDDNYIDANTEIVLPRKAGHTYPAQGPEGKNTILAVVSPTKDRFDKLNLPLVNSRYRMVDNTAYNAKNITLALLNPPSPCGTRDFGSIVKTSSECSSSYSAGIIDVYEVK